MSSDGKRFVRASGRVVVDLGTSTVMLRRGARPRLTKALDLSGQVAALGGTGLIARLGTVALGGSSEEPQLVFDDADVVSFDGLS